LRRSIIQPHCPERHCLFPAFHTRDSDHIRPAEALLLFLCSWRNLGAWR
jgi:hypothetical protein